MGCCIDATMTRMSLLDLIHGDQAGHLKFEKCIPLVQRQAWWHSWRRDLQLFVQCCEKCKSYRRGKLNSATYLVKCKSWRSDRVVHADKLKPVKQFEIAVPADAQLNAPRDDQIIENVRECDSHSPSGNVIGRILGIRCACVCIDKLSLPNPIVVPVVQGDSSRHGDRRVEDRGFLPIV